MNLNNDVTLYVRGAYLKLLTVFVIILFPVRYFVLCEYKYSFVFKPFGFDFNLNNFPLLLVVIFIVVMYLVSFLFPKKIVIKPSKGLVNFLTKLFYIEFTLYIVAVLFLGMKMGSEASVLAQIIALFIFSLVPFSFCTFSLLIFRPELKFRVCILYVIPTLLVASKSGFIHFFIMFVFYKMLKKESVFNIKISIVVSCLLMAYPIFMTIASYGRNGDGNIVTFVYNEIASYGETMYAIYEFVFVKISKRVSGVDVLLLPNIENTVFSLEMILMYIFKGVFTTSIFNFLSGIDNFGMGKLFAIEYINLDENLASSFEPSLLGVIYLSQQQYIVALSIFVTVVLITIFLRKLTDSLSKLFLVFFSYQLVIVIMTGLVTHISQVFRFWLITTVIFFVYKKIKGSNGK